MHFHSSPINTTMINPRGRRGTPILTEWGTCRKFLKDPLRGTKILCLWSWLEIIFSSKKVPILTDNTLFPVIFFWLNTLPYPTVFSYATLQGKQEQFSVFLARTKSPISARK